MSRGLGGHEGFAEARADAPPVDRRGFLARGTAVATGVILAPVDLLAAEHRHTDVARQVTAPLHSDDPEIAAILQRIRAPQFPSRVVRITDFGAVGDGRADCRAAFARPIARCNAEGG